MFNPTNANGPTQSLRGTVTIRTWQYHIAAVGIFITWIINMLMVGIGILMKVKWEANIQSVFLFISGWQDPEVWQIRPNAQNCCMELLQLFCRVFFAGDGFCPLF